MSKVDADKIPIGQRLRTKDGSLWEIDRIVPVIDATPHVSLVSAFDATAIKILSVDAFFDKGLFSLVES